MRLLIHIAAILFITSHGFSQQDTLHYFDRPHVIDGVYIVDEPYTNDCFKEEKFKTIWREIQYRTWEKIQTDSIDLGHAYDCPEIAVELIGKELHHFSTNYQKTDEDRKYESARIDELKLQLLMIGKNQNPVVQAKSNFLLGHQMVWFEKDGRKRKIGFLKKYIEILDSVPGVLETGQNYGPNLFDYRNTLRTLIIATAKFDDPSLGSKYIHKLMQTFANSNYEDDLIRDAAYYYALKEDQDSSLYYLNKLKVKKAEYRWNYYSGYFEIQLLNWLNNHFDPYTIYNSVEEFEANIPDSITNRKDQNEIESSKRFGYSTIHYQYYPDIDGQHRIVKFKDKNEEAIFEPGQIPLSYILFEKGKLKKITYMNPLKSRINTFKRFIMEYDEQEMVRRLHVYTGVYQIMVVYNKKNRGKYYLDRKKVKRKIVFPMMKKYFLQEGLSNFFTYHIPGGYEEMNDL